MKRLEHRLDLRDVFEVVEGFGNLHFQYIVDRLASIPNLEVSRLKPPASQTGQVTQMSARKSISSLLDPFPSHASHRPPGLLKLNRPGW